MEKTIPQVDPTVSITYRMKSVTCHSKRARQASKQEPKQVFHVDCSSPWTEEQATDKREHVW